MPRRLLKLLLSTSFLIAAFGEYSKVLATTCKLEASHVKSTAILKSTRLQNTYLAMQERREVKQHLESESPLPLKPWLTMV